MRRQLLPALVAFVAFTPCFGIAYPLGDHGGLATRLPASGRRVARRA